MSDEVDFLHADEDKKVSYKLILRFLLGMFRHSRSSQNSKFAISLQYLKEEVKDEVDFLREDKYQRFLQVDFSTLGLTLPVVKLSCWSAWSSILKVLKVKSLQYLYNIKREVRDGVYFLHSVGIIIFWWKWQDMSKVPKMEVGNICAIP